MKNIAATFQQLREKLYPSSNFVASDPKVMQLDSKTEFTPVENFQTIRNVLSNEGFDINSDAIYAQLKPGLTKDKFDEMEIISFSRGVTARFHEIFANPMIIERAIQIKLDNVNKLIGFIHRNEDFLPDTLPDSADPYQRLMYETVIRDYKSGTLHAYRDRFVPEAASEAFINLKSQWDQKTQELNQGKYVYTCQMEETAQAFNALGEKVERMSETCRNAFFKAANLDQSDLAGLRKDVAVKVAGEVLKSNNDYQKATELLDKGGCDLTDRAIYQALGVTSQVYKIRYEKHIESLEARGCTRPKTIYFQPAAL